jgi:site-specific recombinase XerC
MLVPDARGAQELRRALAIADSLPPDLAEPVHRWIQVLQGRGSRPGLPLAPHTICAYVRCASTVVQQWAQQGLALRAVTAKDIELAVTAARGPGRRTLHTALRSLFRALKRERVVFRDPARAVVLTTAYPLPRPLPQDALHLAAEAIRDPRTRLSFTLAAIHALGSAEQRGLRVDQLDRSSGRLTVCRPGRADHTVYLDEYTSVAVTAWLTERHRRWPTCTNPHLLVTRQTAVDITQPPVSSNAIAKPLHRLGLSLDRLRTDRIFDEAKHARDPLHLMRLFGISTLTAHKYLRAAHPAGTRPDPIAP